MVCSVRTIWVLCVGVFLMLMTSHVFSASFTSKNVSVSISSDIAAQACHSDSNEGMSAACQHHSAQTHTSLSSKMHDVASVDALTSCSPLLHGEGDGCCVSLCLGFSVLLPSLQILHDEALYARTSYQSLIIGQKVSRIQTILRPPLV